LAAAAFKAARVPDKLDSVLKLFFFLPALAISQQTGVIETPEVDLSPTAAPASPTYI
jgi:hypothetical protein